MKISLRVCLESVLELLSFQKISQNGGCIYGNQLEFKFDSLNRYGDQFSDYKYYLERDKKNLEDFWDQLAKDDRFRDDIERIKSTIRIAAMVGGEFETNKKF